jgi:polysaccharide biosynthesis transport protein
MLQRTEQARGLPYEADEHPRRRIDLADIYAFLKWNRRIIIAWAVVCLTIALVYAYTATPLYTAAADVTIDSRAINIFGKGEQPVGDINAVDSSRVESEVEVLRSETIALSVISDLHLIDDPEFVGSKGGLSLLSLIFGFNEDPRALSVAERQRLAVETFESNLKVRRVALTYVLEIAYRSPDRHKAAQIANAVANAYINDQLNNKYQAAKRASIWLQDRIAELRGQSNVAARAVQDYMEKHNIVDTGAGRGLLSDLQVQEINSQMIAATAATAEAKAKLERVQQVLNSPEPGEALGTVSETLHNEVITRLRQKYLDDSQHVEEFTRRLGPNHVAVITWRNDMTELQHSIVDELKRIAQTFQSDYEIAKAREDSIRESLTKQILQAGTAGQAQVDLKELQAASQSYHTIFENFLQKYTEAVQEQSFPISDARVLTAATPPSDKSWPKTKLIALLGLLVGIGAGLGHSVALLNFDRAVRRPRDLAERLGLECIGLVPLVGKNKANRKQKSPSDLFKTLTPSVDRLVEVSDKTEPAEASPNLLFKMVDDPFSHFSEAIRSAKTTLDIAGLTRPIQTIGVISAIPGEGKSTIAVNLAHALGAGGFSTLLIDADMRNPELSRTLAGDSKSGLIEVMARLVSFHEAIRALPRSKSHFLPSFLPHRIANSGDLLASDRMRDILLKAQQQGYDRIIMDLPPLGPISDARAISPLLDGLIVVVRWGVTRFDVLEEALSELGAATDKVIGVVLNKVDYHELKNMQAFTHGYYYNKNYAKYGYTYAHD